MLFLLACQSAPPTGVRESPAPTETPEVTEPSPTHSPEPEDTPEPERTRPPVTDPFSDLPKEVPEDLPGGLPTPGLRVPKGNPFTKGMPRLRPEDKKSEGSLTMVSFGAESSKEVASEVKQDLEELVLRVTPEGLEGSQSLKAEFFSLAVPGEVISESTLMEKAGQTVDFFFDRPDSGWTLGRNRVQVKAGDEVLGQWDFEIVGSATETRLKGFILNNEADYVEESRDSFSTSDAGIYLIVETEGLPAGTWIRSLWTANEVAGLEPGHPVGNFETQTTEGNDCLFTFSPPPKGFLPGSYRVQVYDDKTLAKTLEFEISN